MPRPQSVLIHGGASGVGTAALQLCRAAGVTTYCTVGADERVAELSRARRRRGLELPRRVDFVAAVHEATDKRGVDIILDCIGASYLGQEPARARPGRPAGVHRPSRRQPRRARSGAAPFAPPPDRRLDAARRCRRRARRPWCASSAAWCCRCLPIGSSARSSTGCCRSPRSPRPTSAMDEHHVGKIVLRVS